MVELNKYAGVEKNAFIKKNNESGSTLLEVIISMVILTVGLLGMISAMSYAMLYAQEAEKKTRAKEIAASIVENIFAIRDLKPKSSLSISGWDNIQIKKDDNTGIFRADWFPVREEPGTDGIYGTTDDSCAADTTCSAPTVVDGYERSIIIKGIEENGVVRKKRIDVSVRYRATNRAFRQETISTIVANLPREEQ